MEQMLETIILDPEERNELLFKVKIEGADPAPVKVRLVCEGGELAFMFDGHNVGHDDLVRFDVPVMKDRLKEGTFNARVEVLIENRYFVPLQFQADFKRTVKVMAEAVNLVSRKQQPDVKVSVVPVTVKGQQRLQGKQDSKPQCQMPGAVVSKERLKPRLIRSDEVLDEDTIFKAAETFVKEHKKR